MRDPLCLKLFKKLKKLNFFTRKKILKFKSPQELDFMASMAKRACDHNKCLWNLHNGYRN